MECAVVNLFDLLDTPLDLWQSAMMIVGTIAGIALVVRAYHESASRAKRSEYTPGKPILNHQPASQWKPKAGGDR